MNYWYLLLAIPGFILVYNLIKKLLPKGNLLHELMHMIDFWWKVWQMPTHQMKVSKYSYGPHSRQYILCCEPPGKNKISEEVVVYFHGGGWMLGTPEKFKSNAQFFVDQGYTVYLPSYRRIPFFSYREIDQDLDLILEKIKDLNAEKGIPGSRLLVGGMSAGGNLAALLAFDRDRHSRLKINQKLFSGIFLFGAPLDLDGMKDSLILKWYAGKRQSKKYLKASPVTHLQAREDLPLCCWHGAKDGMVALAASERFIEQLKKVHTGILHYQVVATGTHINAASWVHSDNEVRAFLKNWLAASSPR